MNHLEIFQKFRKNLAYRIVHCHRAETSANDEDDRFVCGKVAEFQRLKFISGKEFLADRRTGQDGFVGRKTADRFREIAADFGSCRDTKLIGKAGRHIRFVDDRRDFSALCGDNHRNSDEAAFGKHNIRFQLFQQLARLRKAFEYTERV